MRLFIFLIFILFNVSISFAAIDNAGTVTVKDGNIYYTSGQNQTLQITHSASDTSPVLSPDKTMIAFVRKTKDPIPERCLDLSDAKYGNQIWLYNLASKEEKLLVANNYDCSNPQTKILDPTSLQFSSDNKILYFITSGWVTSGALHAVNIDGKDLRFIIPANSVEVVSNGRYEGYLIVMQHRYFIGGGSYDWYWLFSPQGKEEGTLGESISQDQRDFIESRQ